MNKRDHAYEISVAAITGVVVLILAIVAGILFFRDSDLENAIDAFEDRDYVGAIEELNQLVLVADYESSEKMHYYRAKSRLDRLADKLEKNSTMSSLNRPWRKKTLPITTRRERKSRIIFPD